MERTTDSRVKEKRPLTTPRREVRRVLLIEIDAFFDPPHYTATDHATARRAWYEKLPHDPTKVLNLAKPALEKIYRAGWDILYWSSRSAADYIPIVDLLQRIGVWTFTAPEVRDPLYLRKPRPQEEPEITKLSLLEHHFVRALDGEQTLVVVETDRQTASAIQQYSRDRIKIHLSPVVWFNALAVGHQHLGAYLTQGMTETVIASIVT